MRVTIKNALPRTEEHFFYKIYQASDQLAHLFSISANMRDR
ncbi:hypothetical protein SMIM3I_00846 [Streptococcus mitis]|uniref:Uncharacterized protein n=1 Tax=Streptococcus mitis TaxID=28037 RepID=A0A150NKQ5_STRMT|nr:hypothetical protein SMIM3I_00846 [Streptococcus mitis]